MGQIDHDGDGPVDPDPRRPPVCCWPPKVFTWCNLSGSSTRHRASTLIAFQQACQSTPSYAQRPPSAPPAPFRPSTAAQHHGLADGRRGRAHVLGTAKWRTSPWSRGWPGPRRHTVQAPDSAPCSTGPGLATKAGELPKAGFCRWRWPCGSRQPGRGSRIGRLVPKSPISVTTIGCGRWCRHPMTSLGRVI
jgi:hypothetical protein